MLDHAGESALDSRLLLPVPIFVALAAAYRMLAPFFPDSKSRAYILSAISSLTLTATSLPFVYAYLSGGFAAMYEAGHTGWTGHVADFIVVAFGTYLFGEQSGSVC